MCRLLEPHLLYLHSVSVCTSPTVSDPPLSTQRHSSLSRPATSPTPASPKRLKTGHREGRLPAASRSCQPAAAPRAAEVRGAAPLACLRGPAGPRWWRLCAEPRAGCHPPPAPPLPGLCRPLPARGGGRWGAVGGRLGWEGARAGPRAAVASGLGAEGCCLPGGQRGRQPSGLARGFPEGNVAQLEAAGKSGFALVGIWAPAGKPLAAQVRRSLGLHPCFCVALTFTRVKSSLSLLLLKIGELCFSLSSRKTSCISKTLPVALRFTLGCVLPPSVWPERTGCPLCIQLSLCKPEPLQ